MTAKNSTTKRTTLKSTETPLIIKLISGEELLVASAKFSKEKITFTNPYCIIRLLGNEKTNYQLDKWMPFAASDNFTVEKKNIVTYNTPNEELTLFYTHAILVDNQQYAKYPNYTNYDNHQIH